MIRVTLYSLFLHLLHLRQSKVFLIILTVIFCSYCFLVIYFIVLICNLRRLFTRIHSSWFGHSAPTYPTFSDILLFNYFHILSHIRSYHLRWIRALDFVFNVPRVHLPTFPSTICVSCACTQVSLLNVIIKSFDHISYYLLLMLWLSCGFASSLLL